MQNEECGCNIAEIRSWILDTQENPRDAQGSLLHLRVLQNGVAQRSLLVNESQSKDYLVSYENLPC
jgi:hypothetical protein